MNFSTLVKIISVVAALAGAGYKTLPLVWHKSASPAQTTAAAGTNGVAITNGCNLGEVSLTNHYETCVKLGGGKNCTLVPHMIDSRNVELTLSLESRTAAGKTHELSVTQVSAKSGKPMEVALGGMQLSFTPKLISE